MLHRKFIFFINPISGTENKTSLREVIGKKMDGPGYNIQFADTEIDGKYAFLPEKIIAENITDVVVCGGDGSISQVAASLLHSNVNVGIIPMGSGNGLAFAAGISKKINTALDIIIAGKTSLIDSFYINDTFSCMLCGLGFDAQVAHDFAKQKKRGLVTYIKQTIKNYIKARAYPFILKVNGAEMMTDAFFISIANSNQFGNHVTIAPKASLTDGLLDIVIVNKMSKLMMAFEMLRQITAGKVVPVNEKTFKGKGIQYIQTNSLTIINPSLAPVHIDGEPVPSHEKYQVNIIEKAFRLLVP